MYSHGGEAMSRGKHQQGGKKEEETASSCENGRFKSDLVNEIVFRSQAEADGPDQHAAVTYKSAFLRRSFAMQNWANWPSGAPVNGVNCRICCRLRVSRQT